MTPPDVAHFDTSDASATDVTCHMCDHPWKAHDATAIRFCTATMTGAHSRRCACRSENDRKRVLQPMPR
jgi:hypothetical protein